MTARKIIWSITKTLLKIIGKLLLLAAWAACELLSVVFAALSRSLKGVITKKK